jgi:hypothetical protein
MKKLLFTIPVVTALVACGTTNTYDKRVDSERERQTKNVERAIDKAPKWMSELPTSDNAVYANGSSISRDLSMSTIKAKAIAYSKICMAAGGKVDQQTKVFMLDDENAGTEMSETTIRSMCPTVDITGVETVEVKTIAEGPRFRSFVLVALPTGDANRLQARKDQIEAKKYAKRRSGEAFSEMDDKNRKVAE